MSFFYLNVSPDSSPDFGSASLTLVPDGWLSEALAQSALTPDALAEGEYEQYDDLDAIDDPALLAAIQAAMG